MKTELSTTERIEDAIESLTAAYREVTNFIGQNNWKVQSAISLIAEELIGAADYRDGWELAVMDYEGVDSYYDILPTFDHWRVSLAFREGYADGFSHSDE